jgi:hypothetical protein
MADGTVAALVWQCSCPDRLFANERKARNIRQRGPQTWREPVLRAPQKKQSSIICADFRRILNDGQYHAIYDHQDYVSGWHFAEVNHTLTLAPAQRDRMISNGLIREY